MIEATEIISTARGWLGTKFHHQGRVKNVGADCIGLIVGVAAELGIALPDKQTYARQPDKSELQDALENQFEKCALKAGAIALFSIDGRAQHVGIITDYQGLGVIHAYIQAHKVVEHALDEPWQKQLISCYSF